MTTTTSPLLWLKDLCTHFDWLHSGAQALAEGRPLPEPENVPDHAIGEIIRSFQRVDETLRAHRAETEKIRFELQNREQELHAMRQDIEHARGAADEARRALEERQQHFTERESQWARERAELEHRLGEKDHHVRVIAERLQGHAQTLHAVASDLSNVTG